MTLRQSTSLLLPAEIRQAIVRHADFNRPFEACGLLALDDAGRIRFAYAATNRLRSRDRYLVDPTEHFRAIQHAERSDWHIGGVFHSHPDGPARPSQMDIAEARDPSWIYVIEGNREVRAWRIDGSATEVAVEVLS